jgi:hypothetical protein
VSDLEQLARNYTTRKEGPEAWSAMSPAAQALAMAGIEELLEEAVHAAPVLSDEERERLEEALEPFATFAKNNTDEDGWTEGACKGERIVDWFGPSDFRAALEALRSQEHRGEEKALEVVVDFLTSWRYCPVSSASAPTRSCLEDAAKQLLAALPAAVPDPSPGEVGRLWEQVGKTLSRLTVAVAAAASGQKIAQETWRELNEEGCAALTTLAGPDCNDEAEGSTQIDSSQPEPGDEEDWPEELTVGRPVDEPSLLFLAKPTAPIENPSEATQYRRYLPATSQDSGLHPGGAAGEGEDALEALQRLAQDAEVEATLKEWAEVLLALEAEGWQLVHAVSPGRSQTALEESAQDERSLRCQVK